MDMSRYIGIPFAWDGDSVDGASCWGLVRLVLRETRGVEIDPLLGARRRVATGDDVRQYASHGAFVPLLGDQWTAGDVLHMWGVHGGRRTPLHVGLCLGGGKVLHTEKTTGSCVIDVRRKRDAWRPIMGYRYVE